MTVYLPPLTRKKRVPDKYNPDTFRVISTAAEEKHPTWPASSVNLEHRCYDQLRKESHDPYLYSRATQVLPQPMPDYRANRPHTETTDFLRSNVLLLNEPICNVRTVATDSEQENWWPSRTSDTPLNTPPYTMNTTFRDDFQRRKPKAPGSTRHTSNPNTQPSKGAVPVNMLRSRDGNQTLWKEGLSYEHQYNSRLDPSYPIRAKRHGAFVWDKMKPEAAQQFIDYHSKLTEQERESCCKNNVEDTSGPAGSQHVNWPPQISTEEFSSRETTGIGINDSNGQSSDPSSGQNNVNNLS